MEKFKISNTFNYIWPKRTIDGLKQLGKYYLHVKYLKNKFNQ